MLAGALAVLALNDHVLNVPVPGTVTGELSDVADLVVVTVLAAAPVLRGVRLTHPTDLIALAVLPLLAMRLRRPASEGAACPRL